jgi:hypothetical protein
MSRRTERWRYGKRRFFMLQQVLPMGPYVLRVMADLRWTWIRAERLRRFLARDSSHDEYLDRRKRQEAREELRRAETDQRQCVEEFRKLGVGFGDILRGEIQFPCLVSKREAVYIWYDGDQAPRYWRFRNEAHLRRIPQEWFSVLNERRKQRVGEA